MIEKICNQHLFSTYAFDKRLQDGVAVQGQ